MYRAGVQREADAHHVRLARGDAPSPASRHRAGAAASATAVRVGDAATATGTDSAGATTTTAVTSTTSTTTGELTSRAWATGLRLELSVRAGARRTVRVGRSIAAAAVEEGAGTARAPGSGSAGLAAPGCGLTGPMVAEGSRASGRTRVSAVTQGGGGGARGARSASARSLQDHSRSQRHRDRISACAGVCLAVRAGASRAAVVEEPDLIDLTLGYGDGCIHDRRIAAAGEHSRGARSVDAPAPLPNRV